MCGPTGHDGAGGYQLETGLLVKSVSIVLAAPAGKEADFAMPAGAALVTVGSPGGPACLTIHGCC